MTFETVSVCSSQEDKTQSPAVNKAEYQYHSIKRRDVDAPLNISKRRVSFCNKGGKSQSSSGVSSCMLIDALSYAIFEWSYCSRREEILVYSTTLKRLSKFLIEIIQPIDKL